MAEQADRGWAVGACSFRGVEGSEAPYSHEADCGIELTTVGREEAARAFEAWEERLGIDAYGGALSYDRPRCF